MHIDALMNRGAAMDWGICGVGLQPSNARRQRHHPAAFLEDNRAVFGKLADDSRFTRVYSSILVTLLARGVRSTVADLDRYGTVPPPGEQRASEHRASERRPSRQGELP